jgi:selenide,water dikinase
MVTNAAARPGDRLVLTKPLGSGVIATALKAGQASAEVVARAVEVMATLNRGGAAAVEAAGARAGTDVTGYGLLGHLRTMLRASGAAARVDAARVPLLPGAQALAAQGHVPGGTRRNLTDLEGDVTWSPSVSEPLRTLMADAQTSGGLLIAAPPERLDALLEALRLQRTISADVIGDVVEGPAGAIMVV